MEKDLFVHASALEFLSTEPPNPLPRLPNEVPPPPSLQQVPKEVLKSAIVENLISQNEDLMARLKVTLRRLGTIEDENARLSRELENAKEAVAAQTGTREIWLEKEALWKARAHEQETRALQAEEKVRHALSQLDEAIQRAGRFERYQERVRTQVKPRLVELKEYAHRLEIEVASLKEEGERRESVIGDLRSQMTEVTKNCRFQVEQAELRVHELIESYEKSIRHAQEKFEATDKRRCELEGHTLRMQKAERRSDQLENELIELRRHADNRQRKNAEEIEKLNARIKDLDSEAIRLRLENTDMKNKIMEDYDKVQSLEKARIDQQHQLESLRFLHNAKAEENERLKLSLATLERLNIELSARFNGASESP